MKDTHCCIHHPHEGACPIWSLLQSEAGSVHLHNDVDDREVQLCPPLTEDEAVVIVTALNEDAM